MKITVYSQTGTKVSDLALPKEIFEVEMNEGLVHQALKRQLSNSRSPIAHTKTRAEVRGGGKKPFRQKGTGRARQGSSRSPINIGGGVSFGPRNNRNFEIQMPKKQRRKALFMALSEKAKGEKLFGLDKYEDKDLKTKNAVTMISKLPVERNILFVTPEKNETLLRVTKNIPNAKTIQVNYVNIHDLIKYDSVCFVGDSVDKAKEIFTS